MTDDNDKENQQAVEAKWHKPQRSKIAFIRDWVGKNLGDVMRSRKDSNLASRE